MHYLFVLQLRTKKISTYAKTLTYSCIYLEISLLQTLEITIPYVSIVHINRTSDPLFRKNFKQASPSSPRSLK